MAQVTHEALSDLALLGPEALTFRTVAHQLLDLKEELTTPTQAETGSVYFSVTSRLATVRISDHHPCGGYGRVRSKPHHVFVSSYANRQDIMRAVKLILKNPRQEEK